MSVRRILNDRLSSETHQPILLGLASGAGATSRSFTLSFPIASIAFPAFGGSVFAMYLLMRAAILGPLPLVLTMICNGPSRCTLPK
jgi:hypothetical protein